MQNIKTNIENLKAEIAAELKRLGREDEQITLVAVSKTHPVELVDEALRNGITHIGENKVQEAMRKVPMISEALEGFHFIGRLQSNKINQLLSLKPYLIHSIDSLYLAERLHRALGRTNRTQDILIQVNTTGEKQKNGVDFENAEELIKKIAGFSCLRVRGLMTIGLWDPDPEVSRKYFQELKSIYDTVRADDTQGFDYLSMGMSHDWKIALEEGSNMLRIGSAIFGARDYEEAK